MAAGRGHRGGQRVGDPSAAALGHWPAGAVGQREQHHAHRPGWRPAQRHHPVRGHARQQRAALVGAEPAGQPGRGTQRVRTELGDARGHPPRRPPDRGQHQLSQVRVVAGQRPEQPLVGGGVGAQPGRRVRRRPGDHRAPAAIQRVRDDHVRGGESDPALGQPEAPEERRDDGQRMGHRAHVVPETGHGQLFGAAATADRGRALDDQYPQARRSQRGRGGQPVRAAAHHHRVGVTSHWSSPYRLVSWCAAGGAAR